MVPMYISASPGTGPSSRCTIDRTRSFSSAAALSVKVKAMTLRGLTPGWARIAAIRWEMTCVLPDPAHAMICRGWSRHAIASAWERVYVVMLAHCRSKGMWCISRGVSRLNDLLRELRTREPALARDLEREVAALAERRAFGLNFERHVPEAVELPRRKVRKSDKVRILPPRGQMPKKSDEKLWRVVALDRSAGTATLEPLAAGP